MDFGGSSRTLFSGSGHPADSDGRGGSLPLPYGLFCRTPQKLQEIAPRGGERLSPHHREEIPHQHQHNEKQLCARTPDNIHRNAPLPPAYPALLDRGEGVLFPFPSPPPLACVPTPVFSRGGVGCILAGLSAGPPKHCREFGPGGLKAVPAGPLGRKSTYEKPPWYPSSRPGI